MSKQLIIKEGNKLLPTTIIQQLEKRKFEAYYCETKSTAVAKAISLIPEGSSVS